MRLTSLIGTLERSLSHVADPFHDNARLNTIIDIWAPHNYAGLAVRLTWPDRQMDTTFLELSTVTSRRIVPISQLTLTVRQLLASPPADPADPAWVPTPADQAILLDIVEAARELITQLRSAWSPRTDPPDPQPLPPDATSILESIALSGELADD